MFYVSAVRGKYGVSVGSPDFFSSVLDFIRILLKRNFEMEEMDETGRAGGLRWCLGLLTALWAPLRRYFYLTKRDAQGFAVWCVLMVLTFGVKWAYPRWEAARLSEDRLPAAARIPAGGAGARGLAATGR